MSCINSFVFGTSLTAIRPMSQITGRRATKFVVPIYNSRPFRYSLAIACTISSSIYLEIKARSGEESVIASLFSPLIVPRYITKSLVEYWVSTSLSCASYSEPKKAKGAINAPALIPVTIVNLGRVPAELQAHLFLFF